MLRVLWSIETLNSSASTVRRRVRRPDSRVFPRHLPIKLVFFVSWYQEQTVTKKLYVGNLPYTTREDEIRTLFEQVGEITGVTIIIDRETGRSKGFGFVEMATEEQAQEAIRRFNGFSFSSRSLTVNEARPREERSEGGGGGSRGGYGGGGGGGYGGGGGGYGGGGQGDDPWASNAGAGQPRTGGNGGNGGAQPQGGSWGGQQGGGSGAPAGGQDPWATPGNDEPPF